MGWATFAIDKLLKGETVEICPRGNSMVGKINSGDLVIVEPILTPPKVGDIVLCKVKGRQYLHLVKAVNGKRFLIGNNVGGINGWITENGLFGRVVEVKGNPPAKKKKKDKGSRKADPKSESSSKKEAQR